MNAVRSSFLLRILAVATMLLAGPPPASGTGGFERLTSDEILLENPHWAIAVVDVKKVIRKTYNEEAELEINEMLRGTAKGKNISHAFWKIQPSQSVAERWAAWTNRSSAANRPNEWYERPGQEESHLGPLTTPTVGDKLIVFFLRGQDLQNDLIELVALYQFSEKNRETVLNNMAPAEREGPIQSILFLSILINPILCFCLYVSCRLGSATPEETRSRPLAIFWLTLLQFAVYVCYENGISTWTNIRLDLGFIFPALLASIGIVFFSISRLRRDQPASTMRRRSAPKGVIRSHNKTHD